MHVVNNKIYCKNFTASIFNVSVICCLFLPHMILKNSIVTGTEREFPTSRVDCLRPSETLQSVTLLVKGRGSYFLLSYCSYAKDI